jgi:hypothetical protein
MTDRPAFGLDPNTIVQLVPVPPGFVCFHEIEHPDLEPVDPNPDPVLALALVRTDDGQARLVPITAGEFHEDIDLGSGWVRLRMKLR